MGVKTERTRVDSAQVVREVVAGLALAALEVSLAASFAFLVLAPLESAIPRAIGLTIVGTGISAILVGRFSRVGGAIGGPQDALTVVLAAAVAGLAVDVDPAVAEETLFTFIVLVGVLLGIALVVAGKFRFTTSARSLPFIVVSGFLAGKGWLLGRAGLQVMVGERLTWGSVPDLFTWGLLRFWLPGLILALVVVFGSRFDQTGLLFPGAIIVLVLVVHVVGQVGSSLDGLRDGGWLLGPFPETPGWQPVTPSEAASADWGAIAGQSLAVLGLIGVALVSMVLNVAGLEVESGEDVGMEEEVIVAGGSATAVSLLSGLPGFHQLGFTLMSRRLGSRSPISAAVVLVVCLGVGFLGTGAIALMPRMVAGGVLLTVGLSMLRGWLAQVRFQLNGVEGALSVAIFGSIVAFGVLFGIGLGLLAAAISFVFRYSRFDPVRRTHHLGSSRSAVDRSSDDQQTLDAHTSAMLGFELVGYLFFGSIRKVTDRILPELESGHLRYLVLDFSAVRGVDTSAVSGLHTLNRRTAEAHVQLVWSGLSDQMAEELRRVGTDVSDTSFTDVDHALEFVENTVLDTASAEDHVDGKGPEADHMALFNLLRDRGEVVEVDRGEMLIQTGVESNELFLVESGSLTVWAEGEDGRRTRFRRVGAGSVIGEVAFILGGTRTANVVADSDSVLLRFDAAGLDQLSADEPQLALEVQRELSKRLAERLALTSASYHRASLGKNL